MVKPKVTLNKLYQFEIGVQEGRRLERKEIIEQIIKLFKKDSIYTGAVIEFEIRNRTSLGEQHD